MIFVFYILLILVIYFSIKKIHAIYKKYKKTQVISFDAEDSSYDNQSFI